MAKAVKVIKSVEKVDAVKAEKPVVAVLVKKDYDYFNSVSEKLKTVVDKHNLKLVAKRSLDNFDDVVGFNVVCPVLETSHEALKEVSDILGKDCKVEGYDGHKFTVTFL